MAQLKELLNGFKCVLLGARDSLLGLLPVAKLIRNNEKVRKQMVQCFLLNGVILWLSVLLFDYLVLPVIHYLASLAYSVLVPGAGPESESWLGLVTWYTFTGLWVLPVFWISKPINSLWFQDIAFAAYENKKQKTKTKKTEGAGHSISRLIADILFSLLIELLFLIQAQLVTLVPVVGYHLGLLHMSLLYSLYSFEYKWIYQGWIVHQRVALIEKSWPYFFGFGLPLAFLTALPSSTVISACIFAVLFPVYIVSANEAHTVHCSLPQMPVFSGVVLLSNKLFSRRKSN